MRNAHNTSRREFLTNTLVGAAVFNVLQKLPSLESARSIENQTKSRVFIASDSLLRGPLPEHALYIEGEAAVHHGMNSAAVN